MARAHLVRPVLDEEGRPVTNINVRVLDPTTNQPIDESIYLGPLTDQVVLSQPVTFVNGIIDFYLDVPRRVRLGVKKGTSAEVFFEDVDVLTADLEGIKAIDVGVDPIEGLAATDVQAALALLAAQAGITEEEARALFYTKEESDALFLTEAEGNDLFLTETEANALYLTEAVADTKYVPKPPPEPAATDPETGETGIEYARFTLQTVVSGDLAVSANLVRPGLRVPVPGQAYVIIARVDTVPTGAPITIVVERYNGGVLVNNIGTVTIPDGVSVGVTTDLAVDAAKGDILKFRCTGVGSTVAGADLNISVDFR